MPTLFANADRMIPGYEIVREIARGGSGSVYEVRAPGGIAKAAKIISLDDGNPLTDREVEGLRLIRSVRHPYLISIDRVDVAADHITLVMELADCSLREMQGEFLASGAVGIPRERLLPWLVEAAEALDVLNLKYRVHHLDVKPENLFLIAEHLKVGDYGLAREAGRNVIDPDDNAVTPAYAAPELFDSHVSASCDQYSLAVVYMEMLTGALPFRSTDLRQLALFHLTRLPDLAALPPWERPVVGRALSRDPGRRFRSCVEFLEALVDADAGRSARVASPNAETIRSRGSTHPLQSRKRPPSTTGFGTSESLDSLRGDPALSRVKCLLTERSVDDARAAVKALADASLAEWFDFGETLVAYRQRDASGSLLVGVRIFMRDAFGPVLLEVAVTRQGGAGATSFEREAGAVFNALQESVSARPDDNFGRREPRVQVQRPLTLFPVGGPMRNVPIPCTAINTSSRGMGAVSMLPIDAQVVRIRPMNDGPEFKARVVYCRPSATGTSFFVGMELSEAAVEPNWLGPPAANPAGA
jgi:serine/threonine protein kinase